MAKRSTPTIQQQLKSLRDRLDALDAKSSRPKRETQFSISDLKRKMASGSSHRQKDRQQPPPTNSTSPSSPIVYYRTRPRHHFESSGYQPEPEHQVALEDAVEGRVIDSAYGPAFSICRGVDEIADTEFSNELFSRKIATKNSGLHQRIANICEPTDLTPERMVLMDIETTGLSNSPLFLIGVMVWERSGWETRQYLARNYAEEAAVISLFIERCASKTLLITFNGKSFDFPFIRTRAAANGIPFDVELAHFDLLHECRRIWKHQLPNCKLQTLERYICHRIRYDDIPGSQIPEAYHDYVRTENARQMVKILHHNMLDLVTMADLMMRMPVKRET